MSCQLRIKYYYHLHFLMQKGGLEEKHLASVSAAKTGPGLHVTPRGFSLRDQLQADPEVHSAQYKLQGGEKQGRRGPRPESLQPRLPGCSHGYQEPKARSGEGRCEQMAFFVVSEMPRPQAGAKLHFGSGQKWLFAFVIFEQDHR